jgi:hypothetical protein
MIQKIGIEIVGILDPVPTQPPFPERREFDEFYFIFLL